MNLLSFQDISAQCLELVNNVNNLVIQKLYSKFTFWILPYQIDQNDERIKDFLKYSLKKIKFITVYYSEMPKSFPNSHEKVENISECNIDIIICSENSVFIIEKINESITDDIFEEIKSFTTIIKINQKGETDQSIHEEISEFTKLYYRQIEGNEFLNFTLNPILVYSIRKYFMPSNFFKDPSFFTFDKSMQDSIDVKDQFIQEKLKNIFQPKSNEDQIKVQIQAILNSFKDDQISTENDQNQNPTLFDFNESDFIKLRKIHYTTTDLYYLAMHIESLHIFMLKKIIQNDKDKHQREIDFCQNFHNRCFTRFYGFIKKQEEIKGFVYEFMSNGDISSFIKTSPMKANSLFGFMTMTRLYRGIEYLQSQKLIHRDLKPTNILLNHDLIPFISDFETIKSIEDSGDNESTRDFGSLLYGSPEQYYGLDISYPTDIYSFGVIIYFLFEKKDMIDLETKSIYDKIKEEQIPEITNASNNINNLYHSTVKFEAKDRITLNEVCGIINKEILSFSFIENYFVDGSNKGMTAEVLQYFHENILLLSKSKELLDTYMKKISNIDVLNLFNCDDISSINLHLGNFYCNIEKKFDKGTMYFETSATQGNSKAMFNLGKLYYYGNGVHQDYSRAKELFDESAQNNNSDALVALGKLYFYGEGVEKDYSKAKEYFELAVRQNNSEALVSLGNLYFEGKGVKQNFLKAKEYYELAVQQKNSDAFVALGKLYFYGEGVEKDYSKAKEYYELAVEQKNSNGAINLGLLYYFGNGVRQNYFKSKEYFELAAKQNNSQAFVYLANHYLFGYGVKQDCLKAKEYFELAAKQGNAEGMNSLGNLYFDDRFIPRDLIKAKEFFESAAEQNHSESLFNLGNVYFNGYGVQPDLQKARRYFELAGENKNQDALYNLGNMYFNGIGVERDLVKARHYFELSSNLNNKFANNNLGHIYFYGLGVEQNYTLSRKYFELSAKQNDAKGIHNFENHFFNGIDINPSFFNTREYFELTNTPIDSEALFNMGYHYFTGHNLMKAKFYFELSAQQNNPMALLFLGNFYFHGWFVPRDYQKAIDYYSLSIENGNSTAQVYLGNMYRNGLGVEQDYIKAKEYYESAAQKDDPEAFLYLGQIYELGLGLEQDFNKAKEYYEISAQLNNSFAFVHLGNMFYAGKGVKQDYSKAEEYYQISAKFNNPEAFCCLGTLYVEGKGVEQNYAKAKYLFELAAQQNNPFAFCRLGCLYEEGQGVQQDFLKAKEFYEISARQNNPLAFLMLGNLYYNGHGVRKDYLKAKEFYELSAKQNDSNAFCNLGNLYLNGLGVKQDYSIAIKYYELSAKNNNQQALSILVDVYFFGKFGFKQSFSKAKEYLEVLCNLNDSEAFNKLGLMYEYGHGVTKNYEKARMYYDLGSKQNNSYAIVNLGNIYLKGLGCPIDYPRAKYYYEKSSELNNPIAFYLLGLMYSTGLGVKENCEKAIEYYEKAAELHNTSALIQLALIYIEGHGVTKNYEKAKEYIELPARQNHPKALLILAVMHLKGLGFDKDYGKAKEYLELSALQNNSISLYEIADMYSSGFYFDSNINKAIIYFEKCINLNDEQLNLMNLDSIYEIGIDTNKMLYHSHNDLGLIYLTVFNDIEKGTKHIKEAAFAEYAFAQNNLGLINQLYLNNNEYAEYMFKRSSLEHYFALAYFNLGMMKEEKGETEEAMKFYLNTSNNEDVPLEFHLETHEDDRLIISQTFIICYTNLKLAAYYFTKEKYDESKKYFIRSFAKIKIDNDDNDYDQVYKFEFIYKPSKKNFSYLKSFILNFPKFNLMNQPNLSNELINKLKLDDNSNKVKKKEILSPLNQKYIEGKELNDDKKDEFININNYEINNDDIQIFNDPENLFDFVIDNKNIMNAFFNEIADLIQIMKDVIYCPPYLILFGRINIEKKKTSVKPPNDIKNSFYEGFDNP